MNAGFLAGDVETSPVIEVGRLVSTEVGGAAERVDVVDATAALFAAASGFFPGPALFAEGLRSQPATGRVPCSGRPVETGGGPMRWRDDDETISNKRTLREGFCRVTDLEELVCKNVTTYSVLRPERGWGVNVS